MAASPPLSCVLAFDIGVKNLAYALVRSDGTVLALENVNLLPPVETLVCETPACRNKATYSTPSTLHCKRHLPRTHVVLADLDKKKPPPHRRLKELIKEHYLDPIVQGGTSESYLRALHTRFALPVQQPKQAAVASLSLTALHDALRTFVQSRWSTLQQATHVLLENQPAFKNPHMKSVQVLLFATLREVFLSCPTPTPPFHLVHAKKKVGDAPKGDAGYAERKQKSEERVRELFDTQQLIGADHYEAWKRATKKSDMADALCMAKDYLVAL